MKGLLLLCLLFVELGNADVGSVCSNGDFSFNSWLCGLNDWMESMRQWKERINRDCSDDHFGTELEELFSCQDPFTITCCNETMKRCETNAFNCTICYCSDGKYSDYQQYEELWRKHLISYQKALKLYDEKLRYCGRSTECNVTVAPNSPSTTTTEVITEQPQTETTEEQTSIIPVDVTTDPMMTTSQDTITNVTLRNCSGSTGKTRIYPEAYKDAGGILVSFDNVTDGGGWIVFQRRETGSVNFTRNWNDYVNGFGDLEGDYWMGLENIHRLTMDGDYEVRIDMEDWEGNCAYAKYITFSVANSSDNYRLRVSGFFGTSGSSFLHNDKQQFSTFDQDNDPFSGNCAQEYKGGWWFSNWCFEAHLNGVYHDQRKGPTTIYQGLIWYHWKGWSYSLKFTEMKFRRR